MTRLIKSCSDCFDYYLKGSDFEKKEMLEMFLYLKCVKMYETRQDIYWLSYNMQ